MAFAFLHPLRQERLWVTLLWALTLSVGLAGLDWAERAFEASAAAQTIAMLPKENPDDARRKEIRDQLSREPAVASAEWRAPAELAGQLARRYPQPQWQGLFPSDQAWLPWILEVRPEAPLDHLGLLRALAARHEQEGAWRLILWDSAALQTLAEQRLQVRVVVGFWLLLAGLCGMAALARLAWPERGGLWLILWSAVLGVLAPASVWATALLIEAPLDARALAIAATAGFVLASVVAPVLRVRRVKALSIEVGEDADERAWQDSGSDH